MFMQAIITVTSISMGLCPVAWAEQALLTLDVGAGEWEVVHRACSPASFGAGEQHLGFGLSLLGFKGEKSQLLWTRGKKKTPAAPFQTLSRGSRCPLESRYHRGKENAIKPGHSSSRHLSLSR